jgi:hypothetical protein
MLPKKSQNDFWELLLFPSPHMGYNTWCFAFAAAYTVEGPEKDYLQS